MGNSSDKKGKERIIDKFFFLFLVVPILICATAIGLGVSSFNNDIQGLEQEKEALSKPPVTVLPVKNGLQIDTMYQIDCYSDLTDGGASTINPPILNNDGISCEFTLRTGVDYPYAGFYISKYSSDNDPSGNFFNLDGYTHLDIEGTSETGQSFFVYIKTQIDVKEGEAAKFAPFRKEIFVKEGKISKRLAMKDFIVPSWWKDENAPEFEKIEMNLVKVQQFDFSNGNNKLTPEDLPIDIAISKIVFSKDITREEANIASSIENRKKGFTSFIIVVIVLLVLYAIVIFLWKSGKLRDMLPVQEDDDHEKIIISYDKVEMRDEQEDELQRITEQISHNYSNPNFSVEQLAKDAGVSTTKIPALLKQKYSMNFKQYLNMVRVTEAKRLLLETEHQIVTIAHSVGYNNIPHFNRTFKQHTGLSPKKYRKDPESAENNIPGRIDD